MQLLIEQWNKELQNPLGVLEDHRAYHVDDVKRATREVREIKKRIDQATELLETERENIEEAYRRGKYDEFHGESVELSKTKDLSQTCGLCVKPSKENQKELLSEMMREDEEDGVYELTKDDLEELLNESEKEINSFQKDNQLRESERISVEEILPELDKQVWAWVEGYKKPQLFLRTYVDNGGWFWANCYNEIDGDGHIDDEYEVTHWQPFIKPKPQKQ